MAESEKAVEREFEALQEALEAPAPRATRNINVDVHVGHAPQRPYAAVEDALGAVVKGYRGFAQLKAALPDGPGNEIRQDKDGSWYREVLVSRGPEALVERDGELMVAHRKQRRGVSLSVEDARAATQASNAGGSSLEYDAWNGFTWVRRGVKPERDFGVMTSTPRDEELVYVPADPQRVAEHRFAAARAAAAVPPPARATAPAGKGEK